MKKLTLNCSIVFNLFLAGCFSPSPKEYYNKAALNTNLITAYYNFFIETESYIK